MDLGGNTVERPVIIFDPDQLPEILRGQEGSFATAFQSGRVSFEDDLQTAVAISHGISETGQLNMDMLSSVEAAKRYLEGRQGQPVIIVDKIINTTRDPGQMLLTGYIATLSDKLDLVGMHDSVNVHRDSVGIRRLAGIAVSGGYTVFNSYKSNGVLNNQHLQPQQSPVIPIAGHELVIGKPGIRGIDINNQIQQEIIAGEDIIPWIIENLGTEENGYQMYMDIVWSLTRGEGFEFRQLKSLLVEPFVSQAGEELSMLDGLLVTLEGYEFKVLNLSRMLEGAKGEANLALSAIANAHPSLRRRLPRTTSSYPAGVASSLDDPTGEQVPGRKAATERHRDPLVKLLREAASTKA